MTCGCSKILVKFEFKAMYEPGEDAPPQFEKEDETTMESKHVPVYSDRVVWDGSEYFVYHIRHNIEEQQRSHELKYDADVVVICTRKVFRPT